MEQVKRIGATLLKAIDDAHLYRDKLECVIKVFVWWFALISVYSSIDSIVPASDGTIDYRAVYCSFAVLALSLLMEFYRVLLRDYMWISRALNVLFIVAVSALFVLSIEGLAYKKTQIKTLSCLSQVILWFLSVDGAWLLLSPKKKKKQKRNNTDEKMKKKVEEQEKQQELYSRNLAEGELGKLDLGENKNE